MLTSVLKEIVVGDNLKKEDERNSRKRSEISMQDEIQQLALKKREILMKGKGTIVQNVF